MQPVLPTDVCRRPTLEAGHEDAPACGKTGQGIRGGGGNRTRVLRLLSRSSPSAAGGGLSGPVPLPAAGQVRIRLNCPCRPVGAVGQVSPTRWRPVPARGAETGRTSQFLGCERELRLGVYFWFRLFNVDPETTARFSYIDDQSRSLSPPWGPPPTAHRVRPDHQSTGRTWPRRWPSLRRGAWSPTAPHGRHRVRRPGRRWRGACRTGADPWPGPVPPWPGRP